MSKLGPEQSALIAEYGRDAILVLDEDHRILFTSPAFDGQLFFSSDEWTGRSILDLLSDESRLELEAVLLAPPLRVSPACWAPTLHLTH